MKKTIIFFILLALSLSYFFFYSKQKEIIPIKEKKIENDIYINEYKLSDELKNIEVSIDENNFLILNILDKDNKISSVEFEQSILDLVEVKNNIKIVKSSYELYPKTEKLRIYFYDKPSIIIPLSIKYNLNKNYYNLHKQWDISDLNVNLNQNYVYINKKNNVELSFNKKFNYNDNIKIISTLNFKDFKNIDFKIAYSDRIYFSFDNKNINIFLKEKKDKIEYKKYNISQNFKIEKNKTYTFIFNVIPIEDKITKFKYNITILDGERTINIDFIDEGKNNIEFERYKEFKYIFNNMGTEIYNIEM